MPPKKKKGSKKSGKKSSAKNSNKEITLEDIQISEPELNKVYYLMHIQDLEKKLKLYKEKAEKLQTKNDDFMKRQKDLSQEKQDLISFLEKNLINRGDELSDLKDRFFGLQQAKEAEKNQFESTLQEIRSKLQESKDQMTAENSLLGAKLAALEEFKLQKEKYLEEYAELEQILAEKKGEHDKVIESIQIKCDNQHDRLKKEIVSRINMVAADFRKISQKQTSDTTKRTIRENISIRTQLTKMEDKNIELMEENDLLREKVKTSLNRIKELDRICNELASKNISHSKLLHLLIIKEQEQKEIMNTYNKETEIIQSMSSENENIIQEIEKKQNEILIIENENDSLKDSITTISQELKVIQGNSNEARTALIEAVQQLKYLLQYNPSTTTTTCSAKSTFTSSSKGNQSQTVDNEMSKSELKEWGDLETRMVADEKLKYLLDALDYEDSDSRSSSVMEKPSKTSSKYQTIHSASISLATRNASTVQRLSPDIKTKPSMKTKILSDYEIKTQAKLHLLQQSKGFCVPGLLQIVPHMSRHILTSLEKTHDLNRKLNGTDIYSCEEDIDKPIRFTLPRLIDDEKHKIWTNKLPG